MHFAMTVLQAVTPDIEETLHPDLPRQKLALAKVNGHAYAVGV